MGCAKCAGSKLKEIQQKNGEHTVIYMIIVKMHKLNIMVMVPVIITISISYLNLFLYRLRNYCSDVPLLPYLNSYISKSNSVYYSFLGNLLSTCSQFWNKDWKNVQEHKMNFQYVRSTSTLSGLVALVEYGVCVN